MNPIRLSSVTLLLLLFFIPGSAQTITHGDGSALKDQYCYEDRDIELKGWSPDGTFTGCGMFTKNGKWYLNPSIATSGVSSFPFTCVITFAAGGNSLSKTLTFTSTPCPTITNADGSVLTGKYCFEDTDFELIGSPVGGTFDGCGIVTQNGKWYLNPVKASGGTTVFPTVCKITYTPPTGAGSPISENILIQKPVVIYPPLKDTFTCTGEFKLVGRTLYAGAYNYHWTPEEYLADPYADSTTGTITSTQVFKIAATDIVSNCTGSDSIRVSYNNPEGVAIFTDKNIVYPNETFQLSVMYGKPGQEYKWRDVGKGIDIGNTDTVEYALSTPGEHRIDLAITQGECSSTASRTILVINSTSTGNTNSISDQIDIYPNPTEDVMYVNSPVRLDATLSTIEGRKVIRTEDIKTLSLKNLPEGIYLLRLVNEKENLIKTQTIVKRK